MNELLSQLTSEDLLALCGIFLGLVAILGGLSIGLVAVVAYHFRRSRMDDMEATLKMEMIQRGMSAEEIQKVLATRASASGESLCSPFSSPFSGSARWRRMRPELAKS